MLSQLILQCPEDTLSVLAFTTGLLGIVAENVPPAANAISDDHFLDILSDDEKKKIVSIVKKFS